MNLLAYVKLPLVGWLLHLEHRINSGYRGVELVVQPGGCPDAGKCPLSPALVDGEDVVIQVNLCLAPDLTGIDVVKKESTNYRFFNSTDQDYLMYIFNRL